MRNFKTGRAALISGIGVAVIALAPSAQAADLGSANVSCTLYNGAASFSGAPGDTFTLNFQGCDPGAGGTAGNITWDSATITGPAGWTSPRTVNADGPQVFTIAAGAASGTYANGVYFVTPARGVSVTVSGGSGGSSLPSWWKQYQRVNREEACRTGWNPTYGMWANGGRGAWTCVQELYYSGSSWLTR